MKTLELSKAVRPLAAYATDVKAEPVLVTRRGKPLAAVISMEGIDRESLALSTNPRFIAIIEKSRSSRARGTISAQEMRKRLGLASTKSNKKNIDAA
jgi:PHD/YefM family antitoxin component YafN of YafNO toxin-antitoxin module